MMVRVIVFLLLIPVTGLAQKVFPKDFKFTGPDLGTAINLGKFHDLNENLVDLDKLSSNVIYVNFWFVGCKGCMQEEKYIDSLALSVKDNPDILLIAFVPNNPEKIKKYLSKSKHYLNFLIFPMHNFKSIEEKFKVQTYPTHFIINQHILIENFTVPLSSSTTQWVTDRILEETKKSKH